MKKQAAISAMWTIIFIVMQSLQLQAQGGVPRRICGSEIGYSDILRNSGDRRGQYEQLERFTQQYTQNLRKGDNKDGVAGADGARASAIIIPVVVHVLWHQNVENISAAQINDQIAILNRDYRNLNTEIVPSAFTGVRTDMQIQFQLAVRDPNCATTTGIERKNTALTQFSTPWSTGTNDQLLANNPVKSSSAGGLDAWPSDRYLNIWVCKFAGSGLFGYSSFPTYPANVDGVAVDYRCFGSIGTGTTLDPVNVAGGRTLVHETGHWLNLFHIFQPDATTMGCFGASTGDCATSGDRICDTPPQNIATPLGACPSTLRNSCTETPTDQNDMWQNYMDYSSDNCYAMFSSGQKERADACLYGARSGILSSDALLPVASGGAADLWSQDKPDDPGTEPNTVSDLMYVSEDVWVRNAAGTADQQHQNPISNAVNYVYVRIRNRVCGTTGTATVRLFWAKASPSLSWPSPWDALSATTPAMGGQVGTATVTVTGATAQIVSFTWNTPNVTDYASLGADAGHFCLLARIETAAGPNFGLSFPSGTGDLWNYVKNNNNIVWKNIEVVPSVGGDREAALLVGNLDKREMKDARFVFNALPDDHHVAFTDVGKIKVRLDEKLYALWEKGGKKGEGIVATKEKFTVEVQKNGAYLGGFNFQPNQMMAMRLAFDFTKHLPWAVHKLFHVSVEQIAKDDQAKDRRVGGQDFSIRNPKTAEDALQGGTTGPGTGPGHQTPWWWFLVGLLLLILISWFLKKKKT